MEFEKNRGLPASPARKFSLDKFHVSDTTFERRLATSSNSEFCFKIFLRKLVPV